MLEERRVNENSLEGITQELAVTKQAVRDLTRREKQVQKAGNEQDRLGLAG